MSAESLYARWKSTSALNKAQRFAHTVLSAAKTRGDNASEVLTYRRAFEVIRKTLGFELYPCQVVAGKILSGARVAEMKTGEGKTVSLVAPVAFAAQEKKGVHVVTANSYLAKRDSDLLRPVYAELGLTVGCVTATSSAQERREAYECDITYGVAHEFGFDYLRDLLAFSPAQRVQRGLHRAFIDELDAVLLDDARTPMILSASAEGLREELQAIYRATETLTPGEDYLFNIRENRANLLPSGYQKLEANAVSLGLVNHAAELYGERVDLGRALDRAAQALVAYRRGVHYQVIGGEVVLLDGATGRLMHGRRLEDGLHEMLEAKERVRIQPSTVMQAAITYQSFFAKYKGLSGLTGTAMTDAEELQAVYGLTVVQVPTNRPSRRVEHQDAVFASQEQKFDFALETAASCRAKGQPILLVAESVRDARALHQLFQGRGVAAELLTAENEAREAEIIANAGKEGAVTIATAMAGRGTDIKLGGEGATLVEVQKVEANGGLFVLGVGRNALRRVDLQVQGRCARQGQPGEGMFVLSLEDDLLAGARTGAAGELARKATAAGVALQGAAISGLVLKAQAVSASQAMSARQYMQRLDSTMAQAQTAFFAWRDGLFDAQEASEQLAEAVAALANEVVRQHLDEQTSPLQWPLLVLKQKLAELGVRELSLLTAVKEERSVDEIAMSAEAESRAAVLSRDAGEVRDAMLAAANRAWSRYCEDMQVQTKAVDLVAKINKDPGVEFSHRAFGRFAALRGDVAREALQALIMPLESNAQPLSERSAAPSPIKAVKRAMGERWVSRNEPCPCGSGKRFKHCHGTWMEHA